MAEIKTEIFNVKNIDCASCAAKIENGLKAVNGVNDAVLDFASLTLHVKAKDIARIIDEVRKIEPDVELVPKSEKTALREHDDESGGIKLKKEFSLLIVAASLFVLQLFLEDWFHESLFEIGNSHCCCSLSYCWLECPPWRFKNDSQRHVIR